MIYDFLEFLLLIVIGISVFFMIILAMILLSIIVFTLFFVILIIYLIDSVSEYFKNATIED